MTIQDVIKNLVGMEVTEDFTNDVVCAFEDYSFEGKTEMIVSKEYNDNTFDYQTYVNHVDSPKILILIENNKIVKAWER